MLKVKPFLFILFLTLFATFLVTGCSESDSSSVIGGGITDNSKTDVTPVNEFPDNPFSLLGIYTITSQILDGTPKEVTQGSEFRVNVDLARITSDYVDVLVRVVLNGSKVEFSREVSLSGKEIGPAFFEEIFTGMGAKVTGKYTLEFTLAGSSYKELVEAGIMQDGETLILNLDKIKDLEAGAGLE